MHSAGHNSDSYRRSSAQVSRLPQSSHAILGRLAVSRERQGQKLGQFMLMDALR